jgi:hypothetical protein
MCKYPYGKGNLAGMIVVGGFNFGGINIIM